MRHRVFVPVVMFACGFAACDGVRESDYEGEVLASLEGTITKSGDTDEMGDIGVAVFWELVNNVPGLRFAEFTEVTSDFPSSFRLDFHQPPEEELLVEFPDGNAVVLGRIYVTSDDSEDPPVIGENGYGYGYWACTQERVIAFIREDVVSGSAAASYLGCGLDTEGSPPCSALTAGYHLMDLEPGENATGNGDGLGCSSAVPPEDPGYCEPDDVRLAADDLETRIEIDVADSSCRHLYFRDPQTGW
jgi:hypothetical protein